MLARARVIYAPLELPYRPPSPLTSNTTPHPTPPIAHPLTSLPSPPGALLARCHNRLSVSRCLGGDLHPLHHGEELVLMM
ncbi:hypothetical protein E2C01_090156 [Portunus trituberculatus]|uniref:Uncharacterized protein n=1 Tax=Portunus trituberculatus TaxID=210409 RepID=A0A5B7JK58_PORTR|nr:hypothetical protein [Portunus trituberculatus]